jgi:cardiolipin synthase
MNFSLWLAVGIVRQQAALPARSSAASNCGMSVADKTPWRRVFGARDRQRPAWQRFWAGVGIAATAVYTAKVLINLFGPALPYSMAECPGGSNDSPEFLEFLSTVTNASIRKASLQLLTNGPEFYPAELAAIRAAAHCIDMEFYTWQPGEVSDRFLAALVERAQAGIRVRILVDAIGSYRTPRRMFQPLLDVGGQMFWYHPLRWNTWQFANNRSHRKAIIIDGSVGFAGGAGIADHWMQATAQGPRWRDSMFRIEGEAVRGLVSIFAENWLEASGAILSDPQQFAAPLPTGDCQALVVESTPAGGGTTARILFQALLTSARKSIDITTPYFLPSHSARAALIAAARERGVKVRIVVAGPHIDHPMVRRVSRHSSRHLLRAGAEIFEYQPSMIHAKLMVIDHAWCVFGSTNFDHRSFALNDELNVATRNPRLAGQMLRDFEQDLGNSKKLTLEMLTPRGPLGALELAGGSLLERES